MMQTESHLSATADQPNQPQSTEVGASTDRSSETTDNTDNTDNTDKSLYFLVKNRNAAYHLVDKLDATHKPQIKAVSAISTMVTDEQLVMDATSFSEEYASYRNIFPWLIGIPLGALLITFLLLGISSNAAMSATSAHIMQLTLSLLFGIWIGHICTRQYKRSPLNMLLPELEKGRVLLLVRVEPQYKDFVLSLAQHFLKRKMLSAGEIKLGCPNSMNQAIKP